MKERLIKYISSYKYLHSNIKNRNLRWVLFIYITEPFYFRFWNMYMIGHQNRRETIVLRDIFHELGYDFFALRFDSNKTLVGVVPQNVEIIFGLEPNFEKFCGIYSDAKKIYYATGAYYKHQNEMIIKRTNEVNERKKSNIPYNRLIKEHNSSEIADLIIQIGSNYTIETYPPEIRGKVRLIRQSTFEYINYNEKEKKEKFSKNTFLWFGGKGAILKGLDLVLEYFAKKKNYKLHVVGYVEKEFSHVYKNELFHTENIHFHGYLRIDSKQLKNIALESSFVILPSCSEGVPGSVLNMMRFGMIPIVSKYAGYDILKDYGFCIKDLSLEGISNAIIDAEKLTTTNMINHFQSGYEFVKNNFNIENFRSDVKTILGDFEL